MQEKKIEHLTDYCPGIAAHYGRQHGQGLARQPPGGNKLSEKNKQTKKHILQIYMPGIAPCYGKWCMEMQAIGESSV